jgi:hypothetical protein
MTTTTLTTTVPSAASRESAASLAMRIMRCFNGAPIDERTRYLSESTSHADLERRQRDWDQEERRRATSWMLDC